MTPINKVKMEKDWSYAGGGGYDTRLYKANRVLSFPGIKQIWHYGLFNLKWWGAYIYYLTNIK
jgi:hypothetical protein